MPIPSAFPYKGIMFPVQVCRSIGQSINLKEANVSAPISLMITLKRLKRQSSRVLSWFCNQSCKGQCHTAFSVKASSNKTLHNYLISLSESNCNCCRRNTYAIVRKTFQTTFQNFGTINAKWLLLPWVETICIPAQHRDAVGGYLSFQHTVPEVL